MIVPVGDLIGIADKSACEGKIGYKTSKGAAKVARKMARKQHEPFTWYICYFCAKWHVGHLRRDTKHGK